MKRILYKELISWKISKRRKPLLLQGARQVGKTYLVNQFGKNEYKNYVYLNFEQIPILSSLFESELNPHKIIENLSLFLGKKIDSNNTLIFFDEIQISPKVLTSLKYFQEEAPDFHIIAAGSLLGVSVGKGSSFPVGKVNFMTLYPMSFIEFLIAFNENFIVEQLYKKIIEPFPDIIHKKLLTYFKKYLYLGGMPEVLQDYLDNRDILRVRVIQQEILEAYKRDFSKYADKKQAIKNSELWESIPYQLAKENKKFKYSDIKKNARASKFDSSIEWLKNAGLINVANNITIPKLPLGGYRDKNSFKIYMLDSGLLGAMLNVSSDVIITPNKLFSEYNGAFIENFVASELRITGFKELFYWKSKSDAEVDFIIQVKDKIYPLEVKSGLTKNKKSLKSYANKYDPEFILRTNPKNLIKSENFINIPLYLIFNIENLLIDFSNKIEN